MRPRKRDSSFLYMALLAAVGGVLSIGCAIGLPLYQHFHVHGAPSYPAFALFACWGIAALCGAGACLQTYFLTDTPQPPPPRGGTKIALVHSVDISSQERARREGARRAA